MIKIFIVINVSSWMLIKILKWLIHRKNVNNHVYIHCHWPKNLQLYLNKYNRWKGMHWLLKSLSVLGTLLLLLFVGHIDLNNGVIVMYDYIKIVFKNLYRLKTLHAISTLLFGWVIWPTGIIIANRKTADTSQLRIEITYKMIFFLFDKQRSRCTWNPSTNYWFEST